MSVTPLVAPELFDGLMEYIDTVQTSQETFQGQQTFATSSIFSSLKTG